MATTPDTADTVQLLWARVDEQKRCTRQRIAEALFAEAEATAEALSAEADLHTAEAGVAAVPGARFKARQPGPQWAPPPKAYPLPKASPPPGADSSCAPAAATAGPEPESGIAEGLGTAGPEPESGTADGLGISEPEPESAAVAEGSGLASLVA